MTAEPAPATTAAERHASWLELFFDLVVVVAVAQLAHQLEGEPNLRDAGLFVVLFYAVWSVWTSFTLYANVAATNQDQGQPARVALVQVRYAPRHNATPAF